jgi:hypothetical protein
MKTSTTVSFLAGCGVMALAGVTFFSAWVAYRERRFAMETERAVKLIKEQVITTAFMAGEFSLDQGDDGAGH